MNVARDTKPQEDTFNLLANVPLNEGWRHCFQEKYVAYVRVSFKLRIYGAVGSSIYFEIPQASDPLHISIGSDVTQIREKEKTSRAVRAVTSATSHPHCVETRPPGMYCTQIANLFGDTAVHIKARFAYSSK